MCSLRRGAYEGYQIGPRHTALFNQLLHMSFEEVLHQQEAMVRPPMTSSSVAAEPRPL